MISGFVIFMTLERVSSVRDFAVSRFARLYPVFWVALLMAVILLPLAGGQVPSTRTVLANATIEAPLFGTPFVDVVYWSLSCEVLFYVLAAALFASGWRKIEFAALGWLGVSVVATHYPLLMFLIDAPYAYMFVIGIMVYRLRQNPWNAAAWGTLATAIFVSACIRYEPSARHFPGILNAALMTALGAVLWLGSYMKPPRPLAYLGELSYSIYLIHVPMGAVIFVALSRLLPPDLAVLIAVPAVLAVASVINAWIERPAQRWIKSRLLSKRVADATRGHSVAQLRA
jgi:peptidoglycan/LPS O-acetylase OafA/YrhL